MKRIAYNQYGGPELMHVEEFEPRAPGPGEVVVTVKAASINPVDWKIRQGDMKMFSGKAFPRVMGSEFAGLVSRVGDKVVDFRPGDEVVGATSFKAQGAFAEAAITTQDMLAKKPANLSFVEATAVALAGVTAWLALVKTAKLKAGQHVLVNGAMGGVGQTAVTLAQHLGAHVTGRVSPKDVGAGALADLDRVLDYSVPVPDTLARTFDVIFDTNGSLSTKANRSLLKRGGIVVDINPTAAKMFAAFTTRRQKLVFAKGTRSNLETVLALAAAGQIRVSVGQLCPFEEAIPLITSLEAGKRVPGKSVITFS